MNLRSDSFDALNFVDAAILLLTTYGFVRNRSWAPTLTLFWAIFTIALAVLALLVHYVFVAAPEADMLTKMARGDSFELRSMQITSNIFLFGSSVLPLIVVIDACASIKGLYDRKMTTLAAVWKMLLSLFATIRRGVRRIAKRSE